MHACPHNSVVCGNEGEIFKFANRQKRRHSHSPSHTRLSISRSLDRCSSASCNELVRFLLGSLFTNSKVLLRLVQKYVKFSPIVFEIDFIKFMMDGTLERSDTHTHAQSQVERKCPLHNSICLDFNFMRLPRVTHATSFRQYLAIVGVDDDDDKCVRVSICNLHTSIIAMHTSSPASLSNTWCLRHAHVAMVGILFTITYT